MAAPDVSLGGLCLAGTRWRAKRRFRGAVGCVHSSPPAASPNGGANPRPTPAAPSRTGSLLAGAGPGPKTSLRSLWSVVGVGSGGHPERGRGQARAQVLSRTELWRPPQRGIRTLGKLSGDGCWGPLHPILPLETLGGWRSRPAVPHWTLSRSTQVLPRVPSLGTF